MESADRGLEVLEEGLEDTELVNACCKTGANARA
jgi:hypothetical protein